MNPDSFSAIGVREVVDAVCFITQSVGFVGFPSESFRGYVYRLDRNELAPTLISPPTARFYPRVVNNLVR